MINYIQIILDVIFIILIIFLLYRTRSLSKLQTLIKNSKKDFESLLLEGKKWGDEIIKKIDIREKEARDLLIKLENAHKKLLEEEKKLIIETPDIEKTKSVLLLYNQGLSKEEIAKGLNIPKGEIDLILDLINFIKKSNKLS